MNGDGLLDCTSATHRIEALYNALKLIGDMDTKSLRVDSWFDDLYSTEYGSTDEILDDEGWLDDLDEAA